MFRKVNKKEINKKKPFKTSCSDLTISKGCKPGSYWIMPVAVLNYQNTNKQTNIKVMREQAISVKEMDVLSVLIKPLIFAFDDRLQANQCRAEINEGCYKYFPKSLFQNNYKCNFFTLEDAFEIIHFVEEDMRYYNDEIVDFCARFINSMKKMIRWSEINGYDSIMIVGP